jgi:hypothetical protein
MEAAISREANLRIVFPCGLFEAIEQRDWPEGLWGLGKARPSTELRQTRETFPIWHYSNSDLASRIRIILQGRNR